MNISLTQYAIRSNGKCSCFTCHTKKTNSCQNHLWKKTSKGAKYRLPLRYKNHVKIIHLGLGNIIKLKFTTNCDRCAILNVLNCLTKNYEP